MCEIEKSHMVKTTEIPIWCARKCMVRASVREDNPRVLANGLAPV